MTRNRQGSVLLLTLFLVLLAAFALSRFIEKAFAEILSEAVYTERDRLRMEAYSALETTVAILYNVGRMDRELYSPAQGWDDPFALAEVEFPEGMDIRVEFVDEMGKMSLPSAERDQLLRLFEFLGFDSLDSQDLTEALLGWLSQEAAENSFSAHHLDYERAELPYRPPYQRSLRTYHELAAIAGFADAFFDDQGVPNESFYQFASLVSLYHFNAINTNTASPGVVQIWSDAGEEEVGEMDSRREQRTGKPYFENLEEAALELGVPLEEGYGVTTQCVRINITVSEGPSVFALSAVVAPAARSESLRPPPPPPAGESSRRRPQARPRAGTDANAPQPVPYPYRFLEIRENEAIL